MAQTIQNTTKYCNKLTDYSRWKTREVKVGSLGIGGKNPIRVQSMTTTDTMNTAATAEQAARMIEEGCELVRITAPSINEAQNLIHIKNMLRGEGYRVPLVADIHFTPNAAEMAARIVEKVRVNPGNYADKKKFENIEYTDATYDAELKRIRERFTPLVKICKEEGTAMRIGTNHGSLSDRILSRYGDTPLGMVESALEFVRICEEHDFYDIILSMKASNTQVMVQAYRLLVQKMMETDRNYPLHLGVTEAGEGEDGRIKSAVGIGTLLEDGLGDTIRVSLTEEPEEEIPVAQELANRYLEREAEPEILPFEEELPYNPFQYQRRATVEVLNFGGTNVPRVIADLSKEEFIAPRHLKIYGYDYAAAADKWNIADQAADYIYAGDKELFIDLPGTVGVIYDYDLWKEIEDKKQAYPLIHAGEWQEATEISDQANFILTDLDFLESEWIASLKGKQVVLVLETFNTHGMAEQRRAFIELMLKKCDVPVIIRRTYDGIREEQFQLYAATDVGALLIDGMGDGLWLEANTVRQEMIIPLSFGILQATRTRISKTEYISCPSCGRTLFDLQETTAKIRQRTDHLKGVKIGIMGCIVNGPGEMADADYGYVGTGVGKITLYKGKEVVEKNITSEKAVDALIELIKKHGDWVEREV